MAPEQRISVELERLMGTLPRARDGPRLMGIGLDVETSRSVSGEAARFFLSREEQRGLQDSKMLLRLWTVKEAVFKADPDNMKTILGDYILEDPSKWSGTAYARGRRFMRFHYSSIEVDDGFLSIAVLVKGESDD